MKRKMLFEVALPLALNIRDEIEKFCERIEIVGSLRRKKAEVGDIELLAVPKPVVDMFGDDVPLEANHQLNYVDWSRFGHLAKNGGKYKQIELKEGINLDLFICTPPAQWGVLKLIRTGPAEFSHKFVMVRGQGGFLPSGMKVKDGMLWHDDMPQASPEEVDVFRQIGMEYIEPNERER